MNAAFLYLELAVQSNSGLKGGLDSDMICERNNTMEIQSLGLLIVGLSSFLTRTADRTVRMLHKCGSAEH